MYLLDTNVVSELRKAKAGRADPNVVAWASRTAASELHLSAISVMELEMGVLAKERQDAAQGRLLRDWLDGQVLAAFKDRVLAIDLAVALSCARLHVPDRRPERDALIAATALVHGLTLVSRNIRDVQSTGVRLLNPWDTRA